MKIFYLTFLVFGCIGTDIVDDLVDPKVVVENMLASLKVGETYQFNAKYFNNLGNEELLPTVWSSSNSEIVSINDAGLATGVAKGIANLTVAINNTTTVFSIEVGDETLIAAEERTTVLQTVSSYALSGSAILKKEDGKLILSFSDDFIASSSLPGLYVYLSNTTNTINNALEVSPITQFTGAQSFEITDTDDLFEYNIVLFYCKPFLVPVGNGTLTP